MVRTVNGRSHALPHHLVESRMPGHLSELCLFAGPEGQTNRENRKRTKTSATVDQTYWIRWGELAHLKELSERPMPCESMEKPTTRR